MCSYAHVEFRYCSLEHLHLTFFIVIPPVLTVPVGGSVVNVSEGGNAELVCLVEGKPRPPVLWSRANKDTPMPSGDWMTETRDGRLRLTNVSRDMAGTYRCQTAPYNGLNIKRRLGHVQLNVECEYAQHCIKIKHLSCLRITQSNFCDEYDLSRIARYDTER